MTVEEVMTSTVATIDADETLAEAAVMMRDLDVGCLPVMLDNEPMGMITDRDLVIRGMAAGYDFKKTAVRDVVSPGLVTCHPTDSIEEVAHMMEERKIRRVGVMGPNGTLVGILSLGDIATHLAKNRLPGEVLEKVSSD